MFKREEFGSKTVTKPLPSSSRVDCPWETIKMVPTPTLAGHQTSLDSQPNREHPVFAKLELLPEEVKTPFVVSGEKPVPPTVVPPPTPPAAAASAPPAA